MRFIITIYFTLMLLVASLAHGSERLPSIDIQQRLLQSGVLPTQRSYGEYDPVNSCKNYTTYSISARYDGSVVYFPACAYGDLLNLDKSVIKLTRQGSNFRLIIDGADGERGYKVTYIFNSKGLKKRILETEFETQTTSYKSIERIYKKCQ